mmetsp:Transcript_24363/g.83299  ORF Transcript_24363/g.83299 Transcript_24363/m.83299 type:complete len:237 (+) Transcript_24363:769-1479(+)
MRLLPPPPVPLVGDQAVGQPKTPQMLMLPPPPPSAIAPGIASLYLCRMRLHKCTVSAPTPVRAELVSGSLRTVRALTQQPLQAPTSLMLASADPHTPRSVLFPSVLVRRVHPHPGHTQPIQSRLPRGLYPTAHHPVVPRHPGRAASATQHRLRPPLRFRAVLALSAAQAAPAAPHAPAEQIARIAQPPASGYAGMSPAAKQRASPLGLLQKSCRQHEPGRRWGKAPSRRCAPRTRR